MKARLTLIAAAIALAACSKPASTPSASTPVDASTSSAGTSTGAGRSTSAGANPRTDTSVGADMSAGVSSRTDTEAGATATAATNARASTSEHARLPSAPSGETGIAWRMAASDADVDAAFALARREGKPVFLYWGAAWCPPCNQVKAVLFNRVEFIERTRAFVPVYIDGDSPGAQKLGTRFKVRGYPTMVLFAPDGREMTRLPGEVDPAQATQVLTLGMSAARPVRAVLEDARRGTSRLTPNEWKLLAFYAWDTDEQQLAAQGKTPALLERLAAACPADQPEAATRLLLKALAASEGERPAAPPAASARDRVVSVLSDGAAARANLDVLTNNAAEIVRAVSARGTPERRRVIEAYDAAMRTLQADATLSRADRLTALLARVDLARIDMPKDAKPDAPPTVLPPPLIADVREQSARMDREITDGYERQAVITEAAYVLAQAGLVDESDDLLKRNLAKSHSPYYLMSQLAANARRRGDAAGALRWSQEAFDRAEGPATRLQWGASLVGALVELAPTDEARIESAARRVFAEAAAQPGAFYERSARSLARVGEQLAKWNRNGAHAAVLNRLRAQLDGVCAALPSDDGAQRAACRSVLKRGRTPAGKSA